MLLSLHTDAYIISESTLQTGVFMLKSKWNTSVSYISVALRPRERSLLISRGNVLDVSNTIQTI
jgi:hypothetical protein